MIIERELMNELPKETEIRNMIHRITDFRYQFTLYGTVTF